MDIERLKELKAEFEEACKYNDMRYMSTATEDDVLELIDEAIDQLIGDINDNEWYCIQGGSESHMEEWKRGLIIAGLRRLRED